MTAETIVELLSARDAGRWTTDGPCEGGEVGAFRGRRPDGTAVVFKWLEAAAEGEGWTGSGDLARSLALVRRLRTLGYPIPAHDDLVEVPGALVVIQELVSVGEVLDRLSHRLLERLLQLNELQTGQATGDCDWTRFVAHSLLEGEDGYCIHASLRSHSSAGAALLERMQRIGFEMENGSLPSADVVHFDFHHRNVLQHDDAVVAVIDWEGCCPGDRVFDLVTLGFGMAMAETEAGVEDRLWREVSLVGEPEAVRAYVAHMGLRLVDWSIRRHPADVPLWMDTATRHLDRWS